MNMKVVLSLCFLIFLNQFGVVLCRQYGVQSQSTRRSVLRPCILCCGRKETEPNALRNLIGKGKKSTDLIVSSTCKTDQNGEGNSQLSGMKEDGSRLKGAAITSDVIGIEAIPKDSCRVGLDNTVQTQINVISKSDPDQSDDEAGKNYNFKQCFSESPPIVPYQGFFLIFAESMTTFMFLDATKANWFFTDYLDGCDIFVATDTTQLDKPLVIHSNKNDLREESDKVRLKAKGEIVDKIMANVQLTKPSYKLRARLYVTQSLPNVNDYFTGYLNDVRHSGLRLYTYDSVTFDKHLFFGYYDKVWKFYVKPIKAGGTTTQIEF